MIRHVASTGALWLGLGRVADGKAASKLKAEGGR
jgi:hypothetical protein